MSFPSVSVVIPTYRREKVLVDSIAMLLALEGPPDELIVVDQTSAHETGTTSALSAWQEQGAIRWLRLVEPSVTHAMNIGLAASTCDTLLFLDDDIIPSTQLVAHHKSALRAAGDKSIVAGRVLQPWHEGGDFSADVHFHFACVRPQTITEFMGGNFSIFRHAAIELGGFDENFVRVAYRFEADFAKRWLASGGTIRYEPNAMIHHLKADSGGTRSFGHHLTTVRPDHAVGEYYFEIKHRGALGAMPNMTKRLVRSVATRHHLRRPWYVPLTIAAELRGLLWAVRLWRQGPQYMSERDGQLPDVIKMQGGGSP